MKMRSPIQTSHYLARLFGGPRPRHARPAQQSLVACIRLHGLDTLRFCNRYCHVTTGCNSTASIYFREPDAARSSNSSLLSTYATVASSYTVTGTASASDLATVTKVLVEATIRTTTPPSRSRVRAVVTGRLELANK